MFRMMLYKVFGGRTYSQYYSPQRFAEAEPVTTHAIGALPLPGPWKDAYRHMSADPKRVYMVKTHDHPADDQPAIYIVRNGLAAVRSYKHYLWDVDRIDRSFEQVIRGKAQFGSWGRHLDAWNPLRRSNTLLLKYEDLVERPDQELERVASFIGLGRQSDWVNNFNELHARNPRMYRQGPAVAPETGFTPRQQQMFAALHGDWMVRFNYVPGAASAGSEMPARLVERIQAVMCLIRRQAAASRKRSFMHVLCPVLDG